MKAIAEKAAGVVPGLVAAVIVAAAAKLVEKVLPVRSEERR